MKRQRIEKPKVRHHSDDETFGSVSADISQLKDDIDKLSASLQKLKEEIDRILSEN